MTPGITLRPPTCTSAALASCILISKDQRSYIVLDPNGTAYPGSPHYGLAKLTAELIAEVEAERGPMDDEYRAARARDLDYLL